MKFEYIRTPRTLIRPPTVKDAKLMHDALKQSIRDLKKWMPWAQELASLEDTRYFLRQAENVWDKRFEENEERSLIILDLENKRYIGSTGIKPLNLMVPSFEVGYWVHVNFAGKGLITEAVTGLTHYIFSELRSNRVEIHCEDKNIKSWKVAERLNFSHEGTLLNHRMTADNLKLTNTKLYAMTDPEPLPKLEVVWK